jgi:hypothetical protein
MSSTAEYDAFGPWIYEIHSEEEVPRIFRGHPIDLGSSLMTIKVPREIERREANPTMDLYDIVLSLGPDVVTVLTRRGRDVDTRTVAYRDIQGITELVDLLRGRLTLHAEDSPVVVPFNASSMDVIAHLVEVLRRQYLSGAPPERSTAGQPHVPREVEDDLQNLYRRLFRQGGLGRTLAVQRRHLVTPVGAGGVGKAVARRVWPTTLQSAVVTLGDREIVVLHRAQPFVTGRRPVQSIAHTLLPLERVTGVEVRPSQTHEGVGALLIRVGQVTHEFALDSATADQVAGELRSVVRR